MNWKKVKIGILIFLGLLFIIPCLLYLNAIDLTKKHTARVNALPVFTDSAQSGEFRLPANNFEFLIRVAGMQNKGPGIILLHGFPESSIMWQPLLDSAASRGFRVVAFDQRGYSPDARPSKVEDYQIDQLVKDVLAVADQVGFDNFHLVGHDWGAAVGWKTTMDFPERVRTWTALSIPHLGVYFDAILNHSEQQKRSAYVRTLQKPYLPEFLFQINRKNFFKRVEGIWSKDQMAEYTALQREHGATTATLNWYRAVDIQKVVSEKPYEKSISRPTLYIWGAQDHVVAPEIIPKQASYIDTSFQILRLEAGHSLIQLKQDSVLQAIFLHINNQRK